MRNQLQLNTLKIVQHSFVVTSMSKCLLTWRISVFLYILYIEQLARENICAAQFPKFSTVEVHLNVVFVVYV